MNFSVGGRFQFAPDENFAFFSLFYMEKVCLYWLNTSTSVAGFFCGKFEFLLRNIGHRVFIRSSKFIKSL